MSISCIQLARNSILRLPKYAVCISTVRAYNVAIFPQRNKALQYEGK